MRRIALGAIIGMFMVLGAAWITYDGQNMAPTWLATPPCQWRELGTITSSQAALAVGARDYTTVAALADAKTIAYTVPNDATTVELRFQTSANADADVVNIYLFASQYYWQSSNVDRAVLGTTLTLTGGQQVGPNSNVYVDTIAASDAILSGSEVLDSGNDRIAIYRVDLRGYKRVVIIATTLEAATTLYADARWY